MTSPDSRPSTLWGSRRSLARRLMFQRFSVDLAQLLERIDPALTKAQADGRAHPALELLRRQQHELLIRTEELREQLEELEVGEVRVQEERARYQLLFDASPDAYAITDAYGVVREVNVAASRLFEIDLRFLRGKLLASLIVAEDVATFRDALLMVREDRVERTLRVQPRRADRLVCAVAGTLADPATIFWRFCLLSRARATAAPSTRVASEPRDHLTHAPYPGAVPDLARERAVCDDLQIENRAKDRFIALLSRELRTPITAVLGWAQVLRREHLDEATREKALATIERNARAQAALVDELLDVSRITTGKITIDRQPVDLGALVRARLDASAPQASERGVRLHGQAEAGLVYVLGDSARLVQVVGHLISNAMKFTPPEGDVWVTVSRQGNTAKLVVRDTGRGIHAGLIESLFDCFGQVGDVRTEAGLGLGLYIVQQWVTCHGGHVTAESPGEGKGATFTVCLPARDGMQP